MLQAIVKKGKVMPELVPAPIASKGSLLIKVVNSCISAGTELSSVKSSEASLIKKALAQPEKIRKTWNMALSEGFLTTLKKAQSNAEAGSVTGYSISGVVVSLGEDVTGFSVGDHVAAAGAGIANHAEFVDVPINLAMKIPSDLDFKFASTVTLGGIALQGVRRCDLKLGEFCVVYGAGILGLLSVQMLRLSGVRVGVVDLDDRRLEIARQTGAEFTINPRQQDLLKTVENYTGGFGVDAVLFTAATASHEPISHSFKMCKKKGKVVLVGVTGLNINRDDMYAKELDFIVSTSYGPGRYDAIYEQKGIDYPYAYVRWTENRNMGEYLRLLASRHIVLDQLIAHVFKIEQVENAFQSLSNPDKPLMVLLDYGMPLNALDVYSSHTRKVNTVHAGVQNQKVNVALIGTGGFALGMHLPNLKKLEAFYTLAAVVNRTGHKAKVVADQYGARYATTNIDDVLADPSIDLVMICTRHDTHAALALKSLQAGKHIFVEKPIATNQQELDSLIDFFNSSTTEKPVFMAGFNRRFSAYAQEILKHTSTRIGPLVINYRMNAGFIPADSWVHEDGGRIIGECCHIVDLMTFFTNSEIKSISVESADSGESKFLQVDNKSIVLKYKDGSICSIQYFSVGSKQFPKEYMEIHFDEKTIVMDDYKSLKGFNVSLNEIVTPQSEKGQLQELQVLYRALKSPNPVLPIPLWDLWQTTTASFHLAH